MTRSDFNIRLRFRSERASLAKVRAVVRSVLQMEGGFETEDVDDVVLGLHETLTNVTRHAYGGGSGVVDVTMNTGDGRFTARVRDQGPSFDPSVAAEEAEIAPRESGYGLMLVQRTMDRVTWRRRCGGNETRLERSVRPKLKSRRVSAR